MQGGAQVEVSAGLSTCWLLLNVSLSEEHFPAALSEELMPCL